MIPNNLKGSRCHCAALSLPVMGKEEMRRVPRLPGSLAEELAALPRVPVDGHEMYLAGAGEVDQAYVGTCRREVSGLWSWHITTPGGKVVDDGFGYRTKIEAQQVMDVRLDELNAEACA